MSDGQPQDDDRAGVIDFSARRGLEAEEARRIFALALFSRVVALMWILVALEPWRRIMAPVAGSLNDLSFSMAAATLFFAVLDPIAAVGLWLLAPWGGAVWLLSLTARIFVAWRKPSFFYAPDLAVACGLILLASYLFLSWRANRAPEEESAAERALAGLCGRLCRGWGGAAAGRLQRRCLGWIGRGARALLRWRRGDRGAG